MIRHYFFVNRLCTAASTRSLHSYNNHLEQTTRSRLAVYPRPYTPRTLHTGTMAALTPQSTFKLNSGYEIPLVGFGVYQIPADEASKAVSTALSFGYRHIDSAIFYHNEAACGHALAASGIPRGDIFYTTKIPPKDMNYHSTVAQVDQSLEKAGLDYLDLVLLHSPYGGSQARKGAWKALVEAVEAGKIRSIGVSNYGVHHLDELEQHIKELEEERGGKGKGGVISVIQHEAHPWCVRNDLADWCKPRNIAVEAYCALVRGNKSEDATVKKLSEKYGKTWAQVLARWSLQKGFVPLLKSNTPSRIEENFQVWDFELTEAEVKELETDEYSPIAWDPAKSGLDN